MKVILVALIICWFFKFQIVSNIEIKCKKNYFRLREMVTCHRFLTCLDLSDVVINNTIGFGAVKHVFLATWKGYKLAFSILKTKDYINDFREGLTLLKRFSPSPFIVQLVGFCESENVILTEYHEFNNANNIAYLLQNQKNTLHLSIKLCLNYVEILNFLHNSPVGIRVNCDSNGITKLLSQYLIKSDLTLVMNDLDALPELTNVTVICGKTKISDLITPEEIKLMNNHSAHGIKIGYTEKSDIWKVPDVCSYFLQSSDASVIQYSLYSVHKKCKNENPSKRPTSSFLVKFYKSLIN